MAMRTAAGLWAVAMLAAACSGGEGGGAPAGAPPPVAPAAAPATTTAPAAVPATADTAGAEAFVRQVYAGYSDAPGATGPDLYATAFSAELNRLVSAGGPNGDPPNRGLDFDPVCACQDWTNLTLSSVTVTPTATDRAEARVSFTNMGTPTTQTLLLVREAAGWRIDDVRSADRASLAAELRAAAANPAD